MARDISKINSDLKRAAQRVARAAPIFARKVEQKSYLIGAPKKPVAPKGMSVKQLFRAVPPAVTRAAVNGNVEVIRQQKRRTTRGLAYWFMTSTSEKGLSRTHVQTVREKDKSKRLIDSKQVSVSCDCGMFKYYCDYALHQKGASDLKHSTNEPPNEKNPRMEPWSCKHLRQVYVAIAEGRL